MPLNLKPFKKLCLFVILSFIIFSAFGDGDTECEEGDFGCEVQIDCKDLPEAFVKYEADRNLHEQSLLPTLAEVEEYLRNLDAASTEQLKTGQAEKKPLNIDLTQLATMISDLENIKNLIEDNQFELITQSDNIFHSMEDCLKKKEQAANYQNDSS